MITWQPLNEERMSEGTLLAHGFTERSVQEWGYGEERPEPGPLERFYLLYGMWCLIR